MILFRGITQVLFKTIDPLYQGSGFHLRYGNGTSYSTTFDFALDYAKECENFGWLLEYDFKPKNPLTLTKENFENLNDMFEDSFTMIYNNEKINSYDCSYFFAKKGFDCLIFDYDENDPHVMILNASPDQFSLKNISLFTENQKIVNLIKKKKIPFDGNIFSIKDEQEARELDLILEKFL